VKSKPKESKIAPVQEIEISADALVARLLALSAGRRVCILDSCGVGHLGSHLLIAGIDPVETLEISKGDPEETLRIFEKKLGGGLAGIFTISYDFGLKLEKIKPRVEEVVPVPEPDIYLALFDALVVHDYDSGKTFLTGNEERFESIREELSVVDPLPDQRIFVAPPEVISNFTMVGYLEAIEKIKEYIRSGDTYQTNLTQQLRVDLPPGLEPGSIFWRLRRDHPAPFAAFINRNDSTVVSASPERFFKMSPRHPVSASPSLISTSPIKGTRPRGTTPEEDAILRNELLTSAKDRAENVMIVDLLRNDIGRVCEFGSVRIEKLCDLEEHPTLFHLVSTVTGSLRKDASMSEILRAVFPCGSITGAPKIRTMQIIDEIETANRGLSMGAIGCHVPSGWDLVGGLLDLSVAIRTMVVRDREAVFNVGGGIVIDSDPEKEYEESLLKARALLDALGVGIRSAV
jgi:para-aminobenzoate synthetase component 1